MADTLRDALQTLINPRRGRGRLGRPGAVVGQRHFERAATPQDMEVGDDVTVVVPHEPPSRALWNLHDVDCWLDDCRNKSTEAVRVV